MTRTTSPTQKLLCWMTEKQVRGVPQPLLSTQDHARGLLLLWRASRSKLDPNSHLKYNQMAWLVKGLK